MDEILIAGGGPGGLVAAIALARKGHRVRLFERHPELRTAGAGLTLQVNAIRMLASLGLADAVIAAGERLVELRVETADGRVLQRAGMAEVEARFGQPGVAIHRKALAEVLVAALPPGILTFGATVTSVKQDYDGVTVGLSDGTEARGAALIGADGIHSVVRRAVFGDVPPVYAGYTCWRGVAPRATGLPAGHTVERWGVGRRFGIVPIGPDSTYWFATLNAPPDGADPEDRHAALAATYAGFAEPALALIAATPPAAILRNDIIALPRLNRWTDGRVALLGDAAHAMTPNMGQGACQAIEDAVVLADRVSTDIPAGLKAYEAARAARVTDIVQQSERIGWMAQWENPIARALRDLLVRATPERVFERQLAGLYGVAVPG